MTIRANLVNSRRLNQRFRQLPRELQAPTRQAIRKAGLDLVNDAQASIRQPGRGTVRRDGSRRSAPGDPPASDTGTLLGLVELIVLDDGLAAEVGTAFDYGGFLEFGTVNVAARPWLRPAWQRNRETILNGIATAMNAALRGAGRGR